MVARLFQLTIVKGAFYKASAQDNRIKEILIPAQRAQINDRNGRVIASSINKAKEGKAPQWHRTYAHDWAYSHLIGYLQIASRDDMKEDLCDSHLLLGDRIGKDGIERIFECPLRGRPGKQLVEVQANGREVKTLNILPAEKGIDIELSLDSKLQEKAYEVIKNNTISTNVEVDFPNKHIAIIATKPDTGEILLLLSNPSFNLSAFEKGDRNEVNQYFKDDEKPLFNRATSGIYPPGSTFKPIVAAGALEEGKIDENFEIVDTGTIKAGPSTFGNWYFLQYGKLDGTVNLVKALQRSNDIYFYKIGEKLGAPDLKRWAAKFGLGRPTGSSLSEVDGLLPSAFWKKQQLGEAWYLGDTYNLSIGQGYLLTTPLQLHTAIASFANGGNLCTPKLLKQTTKAASHPLLKKELQTECHDIGLSEHTVKLIREGMKRACETGGTGWPFFGFSVEVGQELVKVSSETNSTNSTNPDANVGNLSKPISVGCKTGTAESPGGAPHAWFTVFAPFDKPEIALTVMVERSGEGSSVAAPIAKEILKSYFEEKN